MLNNPDFYPTPPELIEKMLAPFLGEGEQYERTEHYGFHSFKRKATRWRGVALRQMTVLEPSAGKGDILEYIEQALNKRTQEHETSVGRDVRSRCYAIESDLELAATLQGKNYRLIGHDFLDYQGDRAFDLIIANPPFSAGCAHVLHMWQLVATEGHVVSLINSESIRNPYTEERQLLAKIIADNGSVEHLGPVFQQAERKTNVEVSLIRLFKPADEGDRFTFDFGSRSKAQHITEEDLTNGVARKDIVGNMMLSFEKTQEAFLNYARARRQLRFFGQDVERTSQSRDGHYVSQGIMDIADELLKGSQDGNLKQQYNQFSDEVQQVLWKSILGKLNIQQLLTHKIREDFDKYARQNGYLDFTKENVAQLIDTLMGNRGNILEQAIVAVFDIFTAYHSENRLHVDGWKTNDCWKVNRKIILPNWVKWGEYCSKGQADKFSLSYHNRSKYSDIEKALCYITGTKYNTIVDIETCLKRRFDELGWVGAGAFNGTCTSTFFDMKFHKSGTLHLTFKDKELWEEFNLRACAGKKWLPPQEEAKFRKRRHSPYEPAPAPEPPPPPPQLQLAAYTPAWQTDIMLGSILQVA